MKLFYERNFFLGRHSTTWATPPAKEIFSKNTVRKLVDEVECFIYYKLGMVPVKAHSSESTSAFCAGLILPS
jgi:hypothetical protein